MKTISRFLVVVLWGCATLAYAQTGNVGIGTTTPGAKLHINGDLRVDSLKEASDGFKMLVVDTVTKKMAIKPDPVRIHAQTFGNPIANGSSTTVIWASTLVNTVPTAWNAIGGVFTAPRDGFYEVSASLLYETNLADRSEFNVQVSVNDVIYAVAGNFIGNGDGSAGNPKATGTVNAIVELSGGDEVKIATYHASGATRSLHSSSYWNWVNIIELTD